MIRACPSCHSRVILDFHFVCVVSIIAIVSHFRISVRLCVGVTLSGNVRYFVRVSGALSRGLIHIWLSFISYLRRRSRRSQSSQSNVQSRLALEVSCHCLSWKLIISSPAEGARLWKLHVTNSLNTTIFFIISLLSLYYLYYFFIISGVISTFLALWQLSLWLHLWRLNLCCREFEWKLRRLSKE